MILVLEDVAIVEMRNRGRRSVGVRSICTPKKLLTVTLQLMKCNKTNLRSFVITFSHRNRISAVFDVVAMLVLIYMNAGSNVNIRANVRTIQPFHCIVYATIHIYK